MFVIQFEMFSKNVTEMQLLLTSVSLKQSCFSFHFSAVQFKLP